MPGPDPATSASPPSGIRRADAFGAVALLGLAYLARGYFPTLPVGAWGLTGLMVFGAVVTAHAAWRGAGRAHAALGLPVVLALAFMTAHGLVLAFILSATATAAAGAVWLLLVAASCWRSGGAARAARWGLVSVAAGAYVVLCAWMWAPPDPLRCAATRAHPAVAGLTPPTWSAEHSYPYEVEVLGDTGRVAATFKMAGNLTVYAWDRPDANRLAVWDPAGGGQLAVLPMPGLQMPQYMAWLGAERGLALDRLGFGAHTVDIVDVAAFPTLRLRRSLATDLQVHALGRTPDNELVLCTMEREVLLLDAATLEARRREVVLTSLWDPGFTVTDACVMPGTSLVYLSMLGSGIARVDLGKRERRVRTGDLGFGGGEIAAEPAARALYQTEFFFGALRELDARTLEIRREVALPYKPRPVVVDGPRDLLFVGDWFGGAVHVLRASTFEPLAEPVAVGPYLRALAWDPVGQALYAGSKCGLSRIDVPALLTGAASAPRAPR